MARGAKTKSSKSNSAEVARPSSDHESVHVSVRKISNGYLMSQSHDGPKGYKSTETYHPTKPKIQTPAAPKGRSRG